MLSILKELHISCEDAGRKVRYEAFNEVAGKTGKIAVAHNRNDKVETFFFNLFVFGLHSWHMGF